MQLIPAELLEEIMPTLWTEWTTLSKSLLCLDCICYLDRDDTLSHSHCRIYTKKHQPLDLTTSLMQQEKAQSLTIRATL